MERKTFPKEVVPVVKELANLLYYANSRKDGGWAGPVYHAADKAINALILEVHGQRVLSEIQHSRYGFNFGGDSTFYQDVLNAIDDAYDAIEEEESRTSEDDQ